jgi:hypothetical protein
MKYMLMLYADQQAGAAIPKGQMARIMETMHAYQAALTKAGAFVATAPLAPTTQAKTLCMQGGRPAIADTPDANGLIVTNAGGDLRVHDGPYAETREQFGGYYIIEAESMDAALQWAARCPAAQWGPIEVRPFAF